MLEKKRYTLCSAPNVLPNPHPHTPMPAKKTTKKTVTKKAAVTSVPAKKTAAKKAAKPASEGAPKKAAPKKAAKKATASIEAVAKAAYLNYRRRVEQGLPGCHDSDWLEAERTLTD